MTARVATAVGQAECTADLGDGGTDVQEVAVGALGARVQSDVGHRVLHRPAAVSALLFRCVGTAVEEHLVGPVGRLNS